MADKMTKEEGEALANRTPTPKVTREIQNLEVDAEVPPASEDETPDETATLKEQIAALEAEREELRRGNKAKDKALSDLKEKQREVEAPTEERKPEGSEDIDALIRKAARDAVTAYVAERDRADAPFRKTVEDLTAEKITKEAVDAVGAEAVEKYRSAAEAKMTAIPGLSLADAFKLVVPAGTPRAPATPVAAARTPPPETKTVDREALYRDKLAEAGNIRTRGDWVNRRTKLEEAVRIRVPHIFPHGEGG